MVLPETGLDQAAAAAERLRVAVAGASVELPSAAPIHVTVSIGVAPGDAGTGCAALLARADRALYEAKRGGRNRVCLSAELVPEQAVAS